MQAVSQALTIHLDNICFSSWYLLSSYKAIDDEIDAAVKDKHEMVDMIDGVHPCWVEGLETKRDRSYAGCSRGP